MWTVSSNYIAIKVVLSSLDLSRYKGYLYRTSQSWHLRLSSLASRQKYIHGKTERSNSDVSVNALCLAKGSQTDIWGNLLLRSLWRQNLTVSAKRVTRNEGSLFALQGFFVHAVKQ